MNGTPLAQVEPMGLWCDTIGRNELKLFFVDIRYLHNTHR